MVQQELPKIQFKIGKEAISSHSGLAVAGEWLRRILPCRGSNRGYWADEFI